MGFFQRSWIMSTSLVAVICSKRQNCQYRTRERCARFRQGQRRAYYWGTALIGSHPGIASYTTGTDACMICFRTGKNPSPPPATGSLQEHSPFCVVQFVHAACTSLSRKPDSHEGSKGLPRLGCTESKAGYTTRPVMGEAQSALIVWARPDGFDWRRRLKGQASGVWETSPGISRVRSERLPPFPSIADADCAVGPRAGTLHDTKMCQLLIARSKEETTKSGCSRRQSRRWERKSPSSMFAQVRAQPPSEAKRERCTYRVCRGILRFRPHLEGHDGNSTHLALQPSEVLCRPTLQCPTAALCEVARHVESNCDDIPEVRGRKFCFTVCSGMHNGGS
jgi:hypothetical protein